MSLREITNPQSRGSLQQKAAILVDACQLNLQGMERRVIRSAAFNGPAATTTSLVAPDGTTLVVPAGWAILRAFAWISTANGTAATLSVSGGPYAISTSRAAAAMGFNANALGLQTLIPSTTSSYLNSGTNATVQTVASSDTEVQVRGVASGSDAYADISTMACRGVWLEIGRINNAVNSNAIFA